MILSPLVCFLPLPTLLPSEAFLPLRRAGTAQEVKLADDSEEFSQSLNLRISGAHAPHGPTGGTVKRWSLVLPTIAWFYLTGCVPAYAQEDQSYHTEPSSEDHHW